MGSSGYDIPSGAYEIDMVRFKLFDTNEMIIMAPQIQWRLFTKRHLHSTRPDCSDQILHTSHGREKEEKGLKEETKDELAYFCFGMS